MVVIDFSNLKIYQYKAPSPYRHTPITIPPRFFLSYGIYTIGSKELGCCWYWIFTKWL